MHNIDLILTLAAGLIAALALGYLTHRLGWSPIVGYLLAGILVGPNTPGFVANRALAEQLAEVGVILLMFGVGLHFHIKDLLAVRGISVAGALAQSTVATGLGALAFHALGLGWTPGVVLGLALSVASTVVLIRVLSDNGQLQSPTGRVAIGWLVMEDILTVFIMVLLPAVLGVGGNVVPAIGWAALKVGVLVAVTMYGGGRLVPWLLNKVAETRSRELFTLCVLSVALGIAVGSSVIFGVSMALGAFLAGVVVGQSDFSARAGAEALPMRDAFAVMFFLSVGMLFDPAKMLQAPMLTVATLAIVLIGKPLAAIAIVAAAILSITINPLLYRWAGPIEAFLKRHPRMWKLLNRRSGKSAVATGEEAAPVHRAVVVGHGPIGKLVARILRDGGIEPVIVELNVETFRKLQAAGESAVYGDATQSEVLELAGIAKAVSLILSSSGSAGNTEAIRIARELNPRIHVAARADFLRETDLLRKAGADEVFSGEGEVAQAIAASTLRRLGATPEQIDEARERIRLTLMETHS